EELSRRFRLGISFESVEIVVVKTIWSEYLKLKWLREKSSLRFCSSILFESVERKVVTTVLCEILLHIGGEKSSHDVFDWVSRWNQSREWLSRRFGANIKVESVERGVVTTVLYKIPHPIGRERSPHDVFVRVSCSNQMRERLSRRFRVSMIVETVERSTLTTVSLEYQV